jgi:hypothetical protein
VEGIAEWMNTVGGVVDGNRVDTIISIRLHGWGYGRHSKVIRENVKGRREGYFGGVHMTASIACTSKHNMHATHNKRQVE